MRTTSAPKTRKAMGRVTDCCIAGSGVRRQSSRGALPASGACHAAADHGGSERQSGSAALAVRTLAFMNVGAVRTVLLIAFRATEHVDALKVVGTGKACWSYNRLAVIVCVPGFGSAHGHS